MATVTTTPSGALTYPDAPAFKSANGIGSGDGTVTSVSVVTANNVSGSVANASTTPAITLTVGPASTASAGIQANATNAQAIAATSTTNTVVPANLDAFYADRMKFSIVSSVETVTNSSTYTDSTALQLSLGVGTWQFWTEEYISSSAYATAGCKSQLVFTGTGTPVGRILRGNQTGIDPANIAMTWAGFGQPVFNNPGATATSLAAQRRGRLVVTVAGILKVQFAQNSAVAANTATLNVGSMISASRV